MKRRTILRQLGSAGVIGLAGCIQSVGGGSNSSTESRTALVVDYDEIANEFQVSIVPSITESTVASEHPARVSIETTNMGEERYFSSMRRGLHFHPEYGGERSDEPRGLILWEAADGYTPEGEKWQREPHNDGGAGIPGIVIKADETISNEYLVLDDSAVSGYYPPDTYRFEAPVVIRPDAEKGEPSGIEAEFSWGFSLEVTQD